MKVPNFATNVYYICILDAIHKIRSFSFNYDYRQKYDPSTGLRKWSIHQSRYYWFESEWLEPVHAAASNSAARFCNTKEARRATDTREVRRADRYIRAQAAWWERHAQHRTIQTTPQASEHKVTKDDDSECPICLDRLTEPMLSSTCSHQSCMGCLLGVYSVRIYTQWPHSVYVSQGARSRCPIYLSLLRLFAANAPVEPVAESQTAKRPSVRNVW